MQAKVPQNVDLEDRVVGSFTLRQFMIMLVAGILDLALHYTMRGPVRIFFWLLAGLITMTAAAFAFLRPTEQNLEILVMAGIRMMFMRPQKMVWKKLDDLTSVVKKAPESASKKEERRKKGLIEVRNDFEKLAQIVDSGTFNELKLKDRKPMIAVQATEEEILDDVYAKKVETTSELDQKIMDMVKERQLSKDPLVAEVASVSPAQKFDYPTIKIAPDNFLTEVR